MAIVVNNTGTREGDEVVQIYHCPRHLQRPPQESSLRLPHRRLLDFDRVRLDAGAGTSLVFSVNSSSLGLVDSEGNTYLYPGAHELRVSRGHGETLSLHVTVNVPEPVLIDTLL